jgi:hypothetical protein
VLDFFAVDGFAIFRDSVNVPVPIGLTPVVEWPQNPNEVRHSAPGELSSD